MTTLFIIIDAIKTRQEAHLKLSRNLLLSLHNNNTHIEPDLLLLFVLQIRVQQLLL